mgnify:FL=1
MLGVPFYFVHPCNTGALMASLHDSNQPLENYVVDWMSWVAPMFNIPLPLKPEMIIGDATSISARDGHVDGVLRNQPWPGSSK